MLEIHGIYEIRDVIGEQIRLLSNSAKKSRQ